MLKISMIQMKALKASFNAPEKLILWGIYTTSSNIYDRIFAKLVKNIFVEKLHHTCWAGS